MLRLIEIQHLLFIRQNENLPFQMNSKKKTLSLVDSWLNHAGGAGLNLIALVNIVRLKKRTDT